MNISGIIVALLFALVFWIVGLSFAIGFVAVGSLAKAVLVLLFFIGIVWIVSVMNQWRA